MAFVPQQDDPNKQPGQSGQPGQTPMAPVSTSSAPGAGPGAAPSTSATGAVASNQASPQPFTNLQAYLTANQPQIQQMGQNITGQIGSDYGKIQNDIATGTKGFQDTVAGGYAAPNADIVSEAASNPTAVADDPTKAATFKAQLNDKYTGPANFEGSDYYANLNKEVQDAASKANLVNTPSGFETYFRGFEDNPTAGDTTLDSVLLQGNPDVFKSIQAAAKPTMGLPDYLSGVIPAQNKAVQDAQAAATGAAQNAGTQIGKTATDFGNTLNTNVANANKSSSDYNAQLNDIASKISSGGYASLTPQEQSLIGYDPKMNDLISGYPTIFPTQAAQNPINFSSYFTQGQQAATPQASDVVTPDQLAEYAALEKLTGQAPSTNFTMPTTSTGGTYSLPTDPSQLPMYDTQRAGETIKNSYQDFYQNLLNNNPGMGSLGGGILGGVTAPTPQMKQYMDNLMAFLNQPKVGPQPANPPVPPDPQHPISGGQGNFFGFV